ncbi:hypothetical protein Tco_0945695, partial [Tanacetum coccineum]
MAAPTNPVFAEENLGDPIDIKMDIVHPEPVDIVDFPAATVVRTLARHGEVIGGIQERLLEMPTQRVRSLELIETWLHGIVRDERKARERIERQLGLIQEELESLRSSRLPRSVITDFTHRVVAT